MSSNTETTDPANRDECDKRCAGYALSSADKTNRGGKSTGAEEGRTASF
jgi:hypothetical protein